MVDFLYTAGKGLNELIDKPEYVMINILALIFLLFFAYRAAKRFNFTSYGRIFYLLFLTIIFIAGARLFYILFYPEHEWFRMFEPVLYGFSLFGGLLFATVILVATAGIKNLPPGEWLDINTPGLMGYAAISKIGCHINGCCFGTPTLMPWGIPYTEGSRAYQYYIVDALKNLDFQKWQVYSDLIHPVQLYESILAFLLLIIAMVLLKRKVMPGSVFLMAAGFYSLGRLGLFYLRAAPDGAPLYHFFPWLYLAISVISLGILLIKLMKANELSI
ncbi:MAG: prolipoprotein diacylglyceryl transferase [Syntrophomonadaceae bacterium]|jgi:phosphatidylglycerol:prolipoprotein diacylglycerol transferase|nr:prolipoprotein diacylglyceryl transferase [Syntrophomonadaceae bacterium]